MRRTVWVPVFVLGLALLVGLFVSALEPMRIRAYAMGSPQNQPVVVLARGQEVCQGPIRTPVAIGGAQIAGNGVGRSAWVEMIVRDATTRQAIARGWALGLPEPGDYDVALDGSIPSGLTIDVCVAGQGPAPFSLLGSAAVNPEIVMNQAGKTTPAEFSLVLFERSRHSLLTALPTAFRRASLFRFSWTGPWMFWVLAVALLGTIASCGWAVAAAARADSREEGA